MKKIIAGNILKMRTLLEGPVKYALPIGDEVIAMNDFLGKKISFEFKGQINCIDSGELIKKSYNQGYSYKSFIKLAACDLCIMKPELCHYDNGTCRQPKWGEENCLQPHIVYLANTSGLKVGITRKSQVPTRWIDQGAVQALPILEVSDRLTSGLIEVEIKKNLSDITNWRNMLKGIKGEFDLYQERENIFNEFGDLLDSFGAEDIESDIINIDYPVLAYPEKVKSLSFDKTPFIEGTLQGIKGQYLIFDTGCLNMRKHQGYYLYLNTTHC